MVNCTMCQKSFRIHLGKNRSTRCESCAKVWRQKQLLEEENNRAKEERTTDLRLKELTLQEKHIELEKRKITIKETLPMTGNVIELTCYYDHNSRSKVAELLAGARHALPQPPSPRPDSSSLAIEDSRPPRRRKLPKLPEDVRRPRNLPSIDGLLQCRVQRRFKLEEECSTSANTSGMSVD